MTQSITLASCLTGAPGGMSYVRESLKLRLRALLNQDQTRDWLALLNSHAMLRELAATCPRLIHKIYRPYLSNRLDCQQRLGVLMSHYRFVLQHGLAPAVSQAARAPLQLARFAGKSGTLYSIELRAVSAMEREGEMILQLRCGDALVYSLAFSFMADLRRSAVGIGCVQGPQGADGLELIRVATRDLHGLRPKNLMVRLVRQLGHDYGCQHLLLVGNDNRAVRQSVRKGLVLADYDALWLELGAVRRADGDYQLPCSALQAPVMEEIPSKKRSEARKRHELLEAIIDAVGVGLRMPQPSSLPHAPAQLPASAAAVPVLASYLPLAHLPEQALDAEYGAAIA